MMDPQKAQAFLAQVGMAIATKTAELNQVLKIDAKTKVVVLADTASFFALLTKRLAESDVKASATVAESLATQLEEDSAPFKLLFEKPERIDSEDDVLDPELAKAEHQHKAKLALLEILGNKKEQEKIKRVVMNTLTEIDASINPHTSFYIKATCLSLAYAVSNGKKSDQEAFKKSFMSAVNDYSLVYRKMGQSTMADYIKAAGVALLGVLVGIIFSPLLLVSSDARHLVGSFFQRPETTESKKVKAEMGEKFVKTLFEAPESSDGRDPSLGPALRTMPLDSDMSFDSQSSSILRPSGRGGMWAPMRSGASAGQSPMWHSLTVEREDDSYEDDTRSSGEFGRR